MRFSRIFLRAAARKSMGRRWEEDATVVTRDHIRLFIRSGAGGNGLARYNGIGGNGGSVYARAVDRLAFTKFCAQIERDEQPDSDKMVAEHGEHAKQTRLVGRHGKDRTFDVPLGVEIVGRDNVLLARCSVLKNRYLLEAGGFGGCAANNYQGSQGNAQWVSVNLRLRLNIGLIGYPNAGKSTLMKALVPSKPIEIAEYAFTTTRPQLCYIKYNEEKRKRGRRKQTAEAADGDGNEAQPPPSENGAPSNADDAFSASSAVGEVASPFSLSIADLPGIVEGAAQNRFNAFDCLKHLEYSEIIAMVVDVHGFRLDAHEAHKSALETIALLNREMEAYDATLIRKPTMLLINKVDVGDGEQKAQEMCDWLVREGPSGEWAKRLPAERRPRHPLCFRSVHAISAKQGRLGNVKELLARLHRALNPLRRAVFEEDAWEDEAEGGKRKGGKKRPSRKILM